MSTPNPTEQLLDVMVLLDLVRRMRRSQRDYFKDRTPQLLRECKDLESRVDSLLVTQAKDSTPSMFEERRKESEEVIEEFGQLSAVALCLAHTTRHLMEPLITDGAEVIPRDVYSFVHGLIVGVEDKELFREDVALAREALGLLFDRAAEFQSLLHSKQGVET